MYILRLYISIPDMISHTSFNRGKVANIRLITIIRSSSCINQIYLIYFRLSLQPADNDAVKTTSYPQAFHIFDFSLFRFFHIFFTSLPFLYLIFDIS